MPLIQSAPSPIAAAARGDGASDEPGPGGGTSKPARRAAASAVSAALLCSVASSRRAPGSAGASGGPAASVVLSADNEGDLQKTLDEIQKGSGGGGGGRLSAAPADALDPQAVDHVLQQALRAHGRVDAVACCVGNVEARSLLATELAELDRVVKVNLHTQFNAMLPNEQHQGQGQQAAGGGGGGGGGVGRQGPSSGSVVMVSAALAGHGIPNYDAFTAAKAAVEGLMRAAAATYAPHRVRVNCVAPGLVETGQTEKFTGNERVKHASEAMHPAKRLVGADEVAQAVHFLMAGPAAITGQVLAVDAGLAHLHADRAQDYGV
ncbi:3-oxoacyl-[acyl-carrier-protein] reductase [Monoraphidium neglectum]|uniref:3-oxoacyl-[acyl-carrier-protein] reductase n=1 Tax=Monoraphidium neglectum TaxID=145388 RepID=A0A0D2MDV7_9CHLO|nr:3-oxoacyl-[acyl-carrier-protein] reductase [Monoraphidium neglectum]KIY98946.1 3-oxoacyl-[acyl-carrier-protein] reductase [Monoraphidium neglectum]|eukprot:XP_013897966.1 3-oxoacyl-[acyl-carrier-protein] reductase [Monoraphidium neglectum]